jgi:quinol monooxygenase YgiN
VHARSTTFHGNPDKIDAGIAFVKNEAAPMMDGIDGCRGLSLLVDRQTGQCIATSSWESHAAMRASRSAASDMRMRAATDSGGDIVDVHEFDLAYAHLHVPEMA